MSRTLTLVHAGWSATRSLTKDGRRANSLGRVTRLLSRPDLPVAVAADARRLAAELLIEQGRHGEARHHLRAAGALVQHARTDYLMGLAYEQDPNGDDRRAAIHFRRATEAEVKNAHYRAAFGRAAVRCDRVKRGTKELLAAAAMAAEDLTVLHVVTEGLIEAGRPRMARRVLSKARFLYRNKVEFRQLWERVRFELARTGQQAAQSTQDAPFATDGDTFLLPFVRVISSAAGWSASRTRCDTYSRPRPHVTRFSSKKADR